MWVQGVLIAVAALLALALGTVQIGSGAIFSRAGEPASLPAHLRPQLGVAIYHGIARIAQAPYVDGMLARAALDSGDLAQAQLYAQRLPHSAKRDEVLGEIAQARGNEREAQRYFVRAGDIEAIDRAVDALAARDLPAAYALQAALKQRLERSGTHPDAVAEAYWRLGNFAWWASKRTLAVQNYGQAIALSPLSEKYLLSAGFTAYLTGNDAAAREYFQRALAVNPASADAYSGAGMVALRSGDRAGALFDAERAREIDPHSKALATLDAKLRK